MPHDDALEAAVLGALLLEPQYIADVRQVLTREAFYDSDNAAIYDIICRLDDKGEMTDLYTVSQQAKTEKISAAYLAQLTQKVGSGAQVVAHAHYLAALHQRRRMRLYAYELAARVQSDNDTDDLLDWAQREIGAITDIGAMPDAVHALREVVKTTLDET